MTLSAHEESTGKTLVIGGRYQVRRALGAGGMGVVYEARHNWTGRLVAVKVLSAERVSEKGFDQRFAREARAAARVHHPNVVDVLDSGADPGVGGFYIVQELLEGEDLRARLEREGRLPPRVAVDLMVSVTDGLAAAHELQIIHRDVKPANIFLARTADGGEVPKVIDFGVSKLLDEPMSMDTTTGQLLGTPRYMSPEQLRGERDIDARADVRAAGAVLYEVLAGRVPFEATNHNMLVYEVLSGSAIARIDGVPEPLMEVVLRALERDRNRRYSSMRELNDALIAWRSGGSIPARRSRRPRLALAVALCLPVIAALALRFALHRHDTPRVQPARVVAPSAPPVAAVTPTPAAQPSSPIAEPRVEPPAPPVVHRASNAHAARRPPSRVVAPPVLPPPVAAPASPAPPPVRTAVAPARVFDPLSYPTSPRQ